MKKFLLPLCMIASLLLPACGQDGVYSGKIILGGNLEIPSNVREASDVLLLDGTFTITENGELQGNIYQLLGTVIVNGKVEGDVLQFNGDLILGPQAEIKGNLQTNGGAVEVNPDASITGQTVQGTTRLPFNLEEFRRTFNRQLNWGIAETLIVTILAIIVGLAFPIPAGNISGAIRTYPVVCGAMGILVGIVGLSLIVQMVFTTLLIPISILGILLIVFSIVFGWIGFGDLTGQWLFRKWNIAQSGISRTALGTLIFMMSINLFDLLPGLGDLLSIFSAIIGLGAVFQTRFGMRRFVSATETSESG